MPAAIGAETSSAMSRSQRAMQAPSVDSDGARPHRPHAAARTAPRNAGRAGRTTPCASSAEKVSGSAWMMSRPSLAARARPSSSTRRMSASVTARPPTGHCTLNSRLSGWPQDRLTVMLRSRVSASFSAWPTAARIARSAASISVMPPPRTPWPFCQPKPSTRLRAVAFGAADDADDLRGADVEHAERPGLARAMARRLRLLRRRRQHFSARHVVHAGFLASLGFLRRHPSARLSPHRAWAAGGSSGGPAGAGRPSATGGRAACGRVRAAPAWPTPAPPRPPAASRRCRWSDAGSSAGRRRARRRRRAIADPGVRPARRSAWPRPAARRGPPPAAPDWRRPRHRNR